MSIKALLINDTRSEDHVGCQYVVENIIEESNKVGINIQNTVSVSSKNYLDECKQKISSCDFLLINGEGSLHHNKDRARGILETAQYCNELGLKCFLINTVWQSNSELNSYLSHFDYIACRESLSADEIKKAGFNAIVCPDMTFASKFVADKKNSSKTLVLDSVRSKLSLSLYKYSIKNGYAYLPLSQKGLRKIKKHFFLKTLANMKGLKLPKNPVKESIGTIQSSENILSARFHGTCLSMLMGKNVVSISSNTHKLEGLYQDIGLSKELILGQSEWDKVDLDELFELSKSELGKVSEYVEKAPEKISNMFKDIRSLL